MNADLNTAIAARLAWVAVDWGSSNLRAWAMTDDGQVLARERQGHAVADPGGL